MRSLRLLWMALILVLVVPLYGQVSCNRSCPPSPNPCQVAAGRSIETGQCVYSDIDGASCDYQGAAGSCFDGQCLPADCAAVSAFGYCEQSDGGGTGICMDLQCVALEADDPCLQPGVGRINCCEDAGCSVASGAYCNYPMANGMACDPSGIVRAGPGAEGGICIGGTCVATSGSCADRSCPTYWDSQCQRGYCDPLTGECGVWWVDSTSECLADNSPGYCRGGQCTEVNDDPSCGPCLDTPCVSRSCVLPCSVFGDKQCSTMEQLEETPICVVTRTIPNGERCEGAPGTCFGGQCMFGGCMDDSECDDENECTTNTCNPFGDLCDTDPVMNETPCGPPGQDGLVLARCENGQCLPDLCLNRDCGDPDGNSCTGVCISPYGFCDDDANLPNGTTCENTGECFNGECLPTIPRCQRDNDCEDFNDCTEDRCQATFCDFDSLPNGTPCGLNGQCFFGGCLDFF